MPIRWWDTDGGWKPGPLSITWMRTPSAVVATLRSTWALGACLAVFANACATASINAEATYAGRAGAPSRSRWTNTAGAVVRMVRSSCSRKTASVTVRSGLSGDCARPIRSSARVAWGPAASGSRWLPSSSAVKTSSWTSASICSRAARPAEAAADAATASAARRAASSWRRAAAMNSANVAVMRPKKIRWASSMKPGIVSPRSRARSASMPQRTVTVVTAAPRTPEPVAAKAAATAIDWTSSHGGSMAGQTPSAVPMTIARMLKTNHSAATTLKCRSSALLREGTTSRPRSPSAHGATTSTAIVAGAAASAARSTEAA